MIRFFLLFITLGFLNGVTAQESLKIVLTRPEIEHIFLEQNLELVAEKMNVSLADAAIAQAKLWENPELTISDVNLWTTRSQREGEDEVIPPLFGSFARNTQFSIELSQLIQTANKRGKLIRMEKVSREIAIKEFEELLRGLKTELRKIIFETEYFQAYLASLEEQVTSLELLTSRYERQVAAGNYAKSEWLRLQAALFEVENERMEIQTELNRYRKELKILLNMPPQVQIELIPEP
ncbi:MAG: TolC family protein [Tannerellaceae bacterium]|nr:TolC family protein [Tannerellaceae bacterium]